MKPFDVFKWVGPCVRLLPAEKAHDVTLWALKSGLVWSQKVPASEGLQMQVWGKTFVNPLGLAAGFDKNAEVVSAMLGLGFGFVETGTVTPKPQDGNPRPRVFRLKQDRALINRLGFNNKGSAYAQKMLESYQTNPCAGRWVGINIGKNKTSEDAVSDYVHGISALSRYADYVMVNISSPNTPGLRSLQAKDALFGLLKAVRGAMDVLPLEDRRPLCVKIAPDLSREEVEEIAGVVLDVGMDGVAVSNTTVSRPAHVLSVNAREQGGLSGAPLMAMSTEVLGWMYAFTRGKIPLIGVGGVSSGADVYAKIKAGASLVQLYSALVYQGPFLVYAILRDLQTYMKRDGVRSVQEWVGQDVRM